jgi:hypothetical protein
LGWLVGEGVGCVFVGRARSDSGECVLGWGAGWVGVSGEKKLITLWLLLKLRISGGSEFCFKIYVEREICVKEGAGWVGRMRAGG